MAAEENPCSDWVLTTIAGNDQYGFQDGKAKDARFCYPHQICMVRKANNVNSKGNLLIADCSNHLIRSLSLDHHLVGSVQAEPYRDEQKKPREPPLQSVRGVCAIPEEMVILVADSDHHCIRKIDAKGKISILAGQMGIAGHLDGELEISRFNQPCGLVYDPIHQLLYVADMGNRCVRRLSFEPGQEMVTTVVGDPEAPYMPLPTFLAGPTGLALDPSGLLLFIADSLSHTIRVVDLAAPQMNMDVVAGVIGQPGFTDGPTDTSLLCNPHDVAVTENLDVFIADEGNNCIRLAMGATRALITVAGRKSPGHVDGRGTTAALLCRPRGLLYHETFDGCFLYVSDEHSIRVFYDARVGAAIGPIRRGSALNKPAGPKAPAPAEHDEKGEAIDPAVPQLPAEKSNRTSISSCSMM